MMSRASCRRLAYIMVVVDRTGSMNNSCNAGGTKLEGVPEGR